MELLRDWLAPWYLQIKFVHLLAVMAWFWSTSVAYMYYLVPVFKAWRRNPEDERVIALRDWVMDRFDRGAAIEHVAFPIVMITGPLLFIAGSWNSSASWLMLKLAIVLGLFLPLEIFDYYLSHFGGNKHQTRRRHGEAAHERSIQRHWWFFLVTTPAIVFFATLVVYLAVAKPVWS